MKKTRPKPYKIQKGRKPWKVQKGRNHMDLQPNKFAEKYLKRKREKKGESESEKVKRKRREKTRMPFSPPLIWRYGEGDVW